jgi:hypothetical protein
MPAEQRGWTERLKSGQWILRYRDAAGTPQRARTPAGQVMRFKSKTAALNHYRDVIAHQLRGERPTVEYTLAAFVPVFLERHAVGVRGRTVATLRDRLRHPLVAFGDVPLRELERMADEIAAWQVHLPLRARHGIVQALRQCLDAAVRWGHMRVNPAKLAGPNPKTPRRLIRPYIARRARRARRRACALLPPAAAIRKRDRAAARGVAGAGAAGCRPAQRGDQRASHPVGR